MPGQRPVVACGCGRGPARGRTAARRAAAAAQWAVPAATLALIPKCPMCVAAYVAVATGIGISVTAASVLRTSLIAASIGVLGWLMARRLYRWLRPAG